MFPMNKFCIKKFFILNFEETEWHDTEIAAVHAWLFFFSR